MAEEKDGVLHQDLSNNDGKFYIVDLETQGGLCVAVIPAFWLHDTNFCYYIAKRGDIACAKREQHNSTWLNYRCVYRGLFHTYSQARDKVSRAVHDSDINTTSESEGNHLGREKRIKKTRAVYSPTPNQEYSTEDMESDFECTSSSSVPPMPNGLAETFNRSMVRVLCSFQYFGPYLAADVPNHMSGSSDNRRRLL
ncbi:hypothetical protein DAPPUDRAFT_321541 [Daphnia pulex]|uniref:Uncharacterized protein n=1 Tax=Daphnia pulex TaxID=6669 RepID=E9GSZ0_DAPPU|nr:hypothetical protein DAPPUDRAFT_321541 [Daphnia pulex]|eukprot:EFX77275.1 hypothetical protein DAPPUDRAFT_321541 [Daphnia pulex]